MTMRICKKCGEEKPLTADYFHRDSRDRDRAATVRGGYHYYCKPCRNQYQKEHQLKYRQLNREKERLRLKKYRKVNMERVEYREHVTTYRRTYMKARRRSDPIFKLHQNLRGGLYRCLRGKAKNSSTMQYIGLDIQEFWKYVEAKFTDGMTRENYGKWHVDHIRPLCSFNFNQFEEGSEELEALLYKAWHYTNLQPLWAKDNLSKNGTWEAKEGVD